MDPILNAHGANFKPIKGTALLERKKRRAKTVSHEQKELQACLKRDQRKCRFPGCNGKLHGQVLPIDPCHVKRPDGTWHRGAGGDRTGGTKTDRRWSLSMCRAHHGQYDAGLIDIRPASKKLGMDARAFFDLADAKGLMKYVGFSDPISTAPTRQKDAHDREA